MFPSFTIKYFLKFVEIVGPDSIFFYISNASRSSADIVVINNRFFYQDGILHFKINSSQFLSFDFLEGNFFNVKK